jgi:hypothetical protein
VRSPPDEQRRGPGHHAESPALETITTTEEAISETVARPANVIALADARRWRVDRIDLGSGPYWPSWRCCRSWTTAEASRRAG